MANEKDSKVAQGIYLAQLEAAKSGCTCKTCQILRKCSDDMTAQFLQPETAPTDVAAIVKAASTIEV